MGSGQGSSKKARRMLAHQDPSGECHRSLTGILAFVAGLFVLGFAAISAHAAAAPARDHFPPPLASYGDATLPSLWDVLQSRVRREPLNLWVTLLFFGAVTHTFFTHKFLHWAHVLDQRHRTKPQHAGLQPGNHSSPPASGPSGAAARLLHFLGEVEAVFGIWVVPLFVLLVSKIGWGPALDYLEHHVSYHEPLFVVVIMVISSTRPIIRLAESCLRFFAGLGGSGPGAWWLAILTVGPLLGSLITEPAAMTISALLLVEQFYALKPAPLVAYATLGLLFVNVSVGGVLTHFAAPPVLMVAGPWQWNTSFMLRHFGLAAVVGILAANLAYYFAFRRQIAGLIPQKLETPIAQAPARTDPVPVWVTVGHLLFMAWTVLNAHHLVLLIGGFLFFIAFFEVTTDYQSDLQVRSPILVGFFLAGLVVHGGLQQWWIAPVLGRLSELPLMLGAIGLTALNDNAAITYLSTLVPGLTEGMKHAVVAGAVTGGGLTVIANAPNPAGQSILGRYFADGISPLGLLLGALPATAILAVCFVVLR